MRVINIKGLTQEWATNDNHFIVHITQGTLYYIHYIMCLTLSFLSILFCSTFSPLVVCV